MSTMRGQSEYDEGVKMSTSRGQSEYDERERACVCARVCILYYCVS